MQGFLVGYISLIGLAVGSAINAIVWRLYVGRKWTRGRSMCPDCKHELVGKDLIPVLSWLLLRGRCRYCQKPIHWQYPLVELLTAGVFGWSAIVLTSHAATHSLIFWLGAVLWLSITTLLIIMAVYDARWMILPNKIMFPAIGVAALLLTFETITSGSWKVMSGGLLAAVLAGGGFLGLLAVTRGKAMGGGDVKLAFLMGLLLGLQGTVVAMLIGFYAAALVGVGMIIRRRKFRGIYIPFGPYLIVGTMVAYFYGRDIVGWYLRLNGLA